MRYGPGRCVGVCLAQRVVDLEPSGVTYDGRERPLCGFGRIAIGIEHRGDGGELVGARKGARVELEALASADGVVEGAVEVSMPRRHTGVGGEAADCERVAPSEPDGAMLMHRRTMVRTASAVLAYVV